jgi:uncharacterized protein YlxP (DUF503 family)
VSEHLVVGVARFVWVLRQSRGLKDKRGAIRRIKDRVTARHNVSVAEVGSQDDPQRAVLAIALAGSDGRAVRSYLDRVLDTIDEMYIAPMAERGIELITFGDNFDPEALWPSNDALASIHTDQELEDDAV